MTEHKSPQRDCSAKPNDPAALTPGTAVPGEERIAALEDAAKVADDFATSPAMPAIKAAAAEAIAIAIRALSQRPAPETGPK